MTAGAWRFDPFTRTQRFVGEFVEPPASELAQYLDDKPAHGLELPIRHGTEAGYAQHRRRGEKACIDCLHASATASQMRKERKRRTANAA
jgi:hypothetical protein